MFRRGYLFLLFLLFATFGYGSDQIKNHRISKIELCDDCYDKGSIVVRKLEQTVSAQKKEIEKLRNEFACEGLFAGFVVGLAVMSLFGK